VAGILARQSAEIGAQFDAVRGCAEYGIRVSFPRAPALAALVEADATLAAERDRIARAQGPRRLEAAEFGRHLAERLDRRRAARSGDLIATSRRNSPAYVLRAPEEDVQVLAIDALVPTGARKAWASRIEAAGAEHLSFAPGAEPQVGIVGPGPAYSFVRLTLELARQGRLMGLLSRLLLLPVSAPALGVALGRPADRRKRRARTQQRPRRCARPCARPRRALICRATFPRRTYEAIETDLLVRLRDAG
jgi:hypothetical protein